jgi:hypothetical protein
MTGQLTPQKKHGKLAHEVPSRQPVVSRRQLLAGLLSSHTLALIPWAAAQPIDDAGHGTFLAVSALLVGRPTLDAAQAKHLYEALVADDPGVPAAAQTLLTLINERRVDPLQLQSILDADKSPIAALPRTIATAWFLGVVGQGEKARCIAFETALNAQIVGDVIKPPTYAYGAYGSWARKPV